MADTDPFRQHLVALLSIYALGPLSAPFPKYDGPTNWETSSILRSLEEFSKRLYAAEHALKVSGVYAREKQALPVTEESDVEPILKHRPSGLSPIDLPTSRASPPLTIRQRCQPLSLKFPSRIPCNVRDVVFGAPIPGRYTGYLRHPYIYHPVHHLL